MSRFRRVLRWGLVGFLGAAVLGVLGLGLLYFLIAPKLPDVDQLRNVALQEPMYVYARDGRLMALFGETRRYPIQIEKVPPRLKQSFIAIEDSRFYEHHGVDYKGVARAVWLLATTNDKRVPGGSTITQQVARQFFLSSEYSYSRKIAEMMLAMRMEKELTKDEILELYLNKSFFGNRAYGVAAAAEFYFGKSLDQLSLDEMATLASIPKFPSSGNPITNPERAKIRRDYVLQRMRELRFISPAEEQASASVAMHATPHERPIEVYAPYVAEMVRQEMVARFGGDVLTKGYHVTTTIDPTLQAAADQAIRDGLLVYDHRHGWRGAEKQVELQANETPEALRAHLRGVITQANLLPALVTGTEGGNATVMLGDGTELTLDAKSSQWTGKSPGELLKRGDIVRVRKDLPRATLDKDGKPVPPPADATTTYALDQVPRAQSTLISMEADTGALRALVGGYSFAANKFNRATQSRRQPGSSFKPFLYAAAFDRGYNPASIVLDAPVVFRDRVGHLWRPQNDSGNFAGPMRLREALVQSRNLVSVRLLDAIGVDYARKYISHFGFPIDQLVPNLSMSLGSSSLQPLAVARGYAVFANGGFLVTPYLVDDVKDRSGKVIFKEKPLVACRGCGMRNGQLVTSTVVDGFDLGNAPASPSTVKTSKPAEPVKLAEGTTLAPRAIDERTAYQLVSMMRDVVQRGTGTAAKVLGREDVGGKTGSTNDHRDAWFSGFGGNMATTVWVGRDDYKSLGYREYGGKAALPIWIDYMRVALQGRPVMANDPPEGMVEVAVGPGGHLIPGSTGGITEWVKAEDLERMESYVDYGPDDQAPSEDTYDIF
ncbi:penicillin-binding protein 1A [Lysobacter sp. 2RAF19]